MTDHHKVAPKAPARRSGAAKADKAATRPYRSPRIVTCRDEQAARLMRTWTTSMPGESARTP